MGASQSVSPQSIHEFTVKDAKGKDVSLRTYEGKVLLVVNVASKWYPSLFAYVYNKNSIFLYPSLGIVRGGFTDSNYTQLTEVYSKYKDRGFEILAFPCNQFLKQEPGSSQQAQEFACTRYKAEYPIFGKIHVNGQDAAPVYKFLKAQKPGFLGSSIKWNFTKFLIDKEGHVIQRFSTITPPLAIEVVHSVCACLLKDIKKALGEA
ncbi:hypothetical protein Lal_00023414 [Lupinus albus]|nr:hypothetical protein Lal_00023414 [Lupinus albus]